MRLPRDLSGDDLARSLARLGYRSTRQTGSHLRLTTQQRGEYHITIPRQRELKIGLLNAILQDVADHHEMSRPDLLRLLFS